MDSPFFSVIVPTRNRPQFMEFCLYSLSHQTFEDFEVIVLDNPTDRPCDNEFKLYANDPRFHYYLAERPLSMCDNWERGLPLAKGQYITYIEDKMMLRHDALQRIYAVIQAEKPDMISWSYICYSFYNEASNFRQGFMEAFNEQQSSYLIYDTDEVIREHMNMGTRYYGDKADGRSNWRGKIMVGAFKRQLCDALIRVCGRMFAGYTPDYYPIIPSCYLANKAVSMADQLTVYFLSIMSNASMINNRYVKMREFLESHEKNLSKMQYALCPDIISSWNNVVTTDFIYSRQALINAFGAEAAERVPELDVPNTLACIYADMQLTKYPDKTTKQAEREALNREIEKLSDSDRLRYEQRRKAISGINKRVIQAVKIKIWYVLTSMFGRNGAKLIWMLRACISGKRTCHTDYSDPRDAI